METTQLLARYACLTSRAWAMRSMWPQLAGKLNVSADSLRVALSKLLPNNQHGREFPPPALHRLQ